MKSANIILESLVIKPDASMRDAISALERGGIQLAIVVDDQRRVLGTITDGDIRRALMRQMNLDASIESLMNQKPHLAVVGSSREHIINLMETYKVSQIPVVDNERRVVGVETLHDMLNNKPRNNAIFIMAGGFGARLQPLTDKCPKPLLHVGEKPILELIIENFVEAGFCRFFISVFYLSDMIRQRIGDGSRWNITVQYVQETEPLGTGGALSLLPIDEINESFIMINADLLTALNFSKLLEFHDSSDAIATLCVREQEYKVPYGVVTADGLKVKSIIEKPVYRYFINAGIYALSPKIFQYVAIDQYVDMTDILNRIIVTGANINMFPIHEYWLDIGRIEDFNRAQDEFKKVSNE